MFVFLIEDDEPPVHALRSHMLTIQQGMQTLAWLFTGHGW